MKTRTSEETFLQWLEHLEEIGHIPGRMTHLGEYYVYLYPSRGFLTQGSGATTAFVTWLKKYWVEDYCEDKCKPFEKWISEWCKPRGYLVYYYRDWHGEGFLFEVGKMKTLDQYSKEGT